MFLAVVDPLRREGLLVSGIAENSGTWAYIHLRSSAAFGSSMPPLRLTASTL